MRGLRLCGTAVVMILALSAPVFAENEKPDATLELTQVSAAIFFGYTWGGGTLTFQDKAYPVDIDAFSIFALGFAQAKVSAEVFHLKKLDDFNGTYLAGSVEGTLGVGAGATTMRKVLDRRDVTTAGGGVQRRAHEVVALEGRLVGDQQLHHVKLAPEGLRLNVK